MKTSTLLLVASFLAITSCSGRDDERDTAAAAESEGGSQAQTAEGRADMATLRDYRLSMEKMDRVFAAQMNLARTLARMTVAEREKMAASSGMNESDGLDDMIAKLDANAVASRAVKETGISTREYITASMAMLQASMAYSVMQTRPNDNQDSLARAMDTNPENVKFVRDNMAELQRKQDAMSAELERMAVPGDPGVSDGR